MRPRIASLSVSLATAIVAFASTASALTGTLGPQYGAPLAEQTSQSNVGGVGDPNPPANTNGGSQLNAAYGYISSGTLYLFYTGNLTFWVQLEGGIPHWLPLDVLIDCAPGGQQQLLASNPVVEPGSYDLTRIAGLTLDSGFAADYWLSVGGSYTQPSWPNMHAYFAALPTGGGGSGAYLGATPPGAPGVLSGGTNPDGVQVAFDVSNQLGVGGGCGAPTLAAVQTGIECAIPLAAIGDPTGCVRVCAFVASQDHSMISNQVMGPIPPGTCSLTPAAATDFSSVPGDQFVTICPDQTPTRHGSWGTLKELYR